MKRGTHQRQPASRGELERESALAVSVRRGSASAFERLVVRFESPLFRYACSLLQHAPDAEEVVQDALMRAHRALTVQYDEARCATLALRPWLFKMVRNLASNKRRGKRHQVEQSLEESREASSRAIEPDHEHLDRKRQLLRMQQAIDALPAEARELIVLRFMDEMSYAEIGKTVGATEASLRGKIFRAVALLRHKLEKEGVSHAL